MAVLMKDIVMVPHPLIWALRETSSKQRGSISLMPFRMPIINKGSLLVAAYTKGSKRERGGGTERLSMTSDARLTISDMIYIFLPL